MSVSPSITLTLSAAYGGFPFQTKTLILSYNVKVALGAAGQSGRQIRTAAPTNGWFAPQSSTDTSSLPLSLSHTHSEVWWDGEQIYIRDLESPFGTYVNGTKIKATVGLKSGDIITLGSKISRNGNTPVYITDDQLKPIVAKVGVARA